jgi:hypothetical protein
VERDNAKRIIAGRSTALALSGAEPQETIWAK